MDIFEYIKNSSVEKIIADVKSRKRSMQRKRYIVEIYKNRYEKSGIKGYFKCRLNKKFNMQILQWFEWTQCEDPDYNKFYEKLISDAKENIESYEKVYHILSDDISKEIFLNILKWKVSLESSYLAKSYYRTNNEQYLEPFEYLTDKEVFVDCGGYIGDSTQALCAYSGKIKKVYLYEADNQNIKRAEETLNDINVVFRNVGVGDRHQFMYFSQNGLSSSSFTENDSTGQKVEIVSLDEDIKDRVTFIKMDIEGCEFKALQGCKNHIINDHPCLAVCLYHKPEDLWQIPLYINSLVDSYDYYIRHYTLYHGETVLYAVPKERKL